MILEKIPSEGSRGWRQHSTGVHACGATHECTNSLVPAARRAQYSPLIVVAVAYSADWRLIGLISTGLYPDLSLCLVHRCPAHAPAATPIMTPIKTTPNAPSPEAIAQSPPPAYLSQTDGAPRSTGPNTLSSSYSQTSSVSAGTSGVVFLYAVY